MEARSEGLAGLAQLAGYPLFPVPITSIDGVAYGANIARVMRRTLDTYGPRLPKHYAHLLRSFSDEIEALNSPYESHDRDRPFQGLSHSATIVAPFLIENHGADTLVDALRLWLLSAVYRLTANETRRGTGPFLKSLSQQIILLDRSGEPHRNVTTYIHELHSGRKIRKATAELLATHFGFTRAPSRALAIDTLTSIRPSRPIDLVHGEVATAAPDTSRPLSPDTSDTCSAEAPEPEGKPDQEESTPKHLTSYLQRYFTSLVPDTEGCLSTDEARALFDVLTRNVIWGIRDQDDLCDLVLALMLTTSRDACNIIHALAGLQADSGLPRDHALETPCGAANPIWMTMHGWWSTPGRGLEYSTAETDGPYQVDHSNDLYLPHADTIRQALSVASRTRIAAQSITRQALEQRVREHKATVPSVSQERIRRTLPVLLIMVTGHPRTSQIIEGTDGFGSAAATAYYAPLQSNLAKTYADALRLADIVIHTPDPLPGEDDPRVGAPRAALDGEGIRTSFAGARESVLSARRANQSLGNLIAWHHQLVLHTSLMYAAATAHRASYSLSKARITDIIRFPDSQFGIAYIADKRRKGFDRIAALPATVLDQIDQLVATADELRSQLLTQLTPAARHAAKQLEQAVVGDGPLFIRLDPDKWTPRATNAAALETFTQLPFRLRRLRHFFATRSQELGVPESDIAQQMGHRIDGEPYSDSDPDCPWHFATRIGPHLERYLADIGLMPIPVNRPAASTPARSQAIANLANTDCMQPADVHQRRKHRQTKKEESAPRSVIQPCHIHAYRLALQLETVLVELLAEHSATAVANEQHARWVVGAGLLLLPLWGVTTHPATLRRVVTDGRLVDVDGVEGCGGLVMPDAETIGGIQLITSDQAMVLQRTIVGAAQFSRSELCPNLLRDYPPAAKLLGSTATLEDVCHLASAARRLTAPGQRAAWERAHLRASGPRPSRFLAMMTGKRVRPVEELSPSVAAANSENPTASANPRGAKEAYYSLRRSIRRWDAQRGATHRITQALDDAHRLIHVAPDGSIPFLVAHAVQDEIHNRGKKGSIKPSSVDRYIRHLEPPIQNSIRIIQNDTGEHLDHTAYSEFVIDDWVSLIADEISPLKALRWIARRNRDRPDSLPANINERLDDLDLGCDRPARAGDPISAAEHTYLLGQIEAGSTPYLSGRTPPASVVAPFALAIQAIFALRTSELTHLTLADYFSGHHRVLVRIRERVNRPLKSNASIRTVAFAPNQDQKQGITELSKRIHNTPRPKTPAQHNLLPGPPSMGPLDWMASTQMRFLSAGRYMMNTTGGIPFRPHSYRHSYATAQILALMPRYFEGLAPNLPYAEPRIPHASRCSLRAQQRYVSRQLGHGHPLTTLTHYAHHIPLMTAVRDGWARLPSSTIAKILGTSPESLRNSISRMKKKHRTPQSAIIERLKLPPLKTLYVIDSFPEPAHISALPGGHAAQANSVSIDPSAPSALTALALTAIAFRERQDPEQLARAQGRRIGTVRRDISALIETSNLLGLHETLMPDTPLSRTSRTAPVLTLMEALANLPQGDLHSIALKLFQYRNNASKTKEAMKSLLPDDPTLPNLGPSQRKMATIILNTYLSNSE
ncbi:MULTISPECIES: hypothetical protein [unclassified Thioalkalivibrio]|uniref:hypothetical protein n=1 Tax=unclassified Thioalkalivibrio TaxID=2621013 RepID=UPI001E2C6262|nr:MULTISPECIES: hypothetical protein [unclassified Thioalkalivibrio]